MLRIRRPDFASALTTAVTRRAGSELCEGGAASAGMARISIKQDRNVLFLPNRRRLNFDGSILGELSSDTELQTSNRAGWVLVGGQSRRMGVDKALLNVGNQPLAKRIAENIARVCGPVSLVGDPERYASLGLPVIPDRFPGEGPLAGIEAALNATKADWNLVVACDMPSLDDGIIEELFRAALEGDCAAPWYSDGRIEPLCAVIHRRCHEPILRAIETGTRKVTVALAQLALRYVPVGSPESFANLNTPEDLAQWRRERGGERRG